MKFELKYVEINISNASNESGEKFVELFENNLNKYASDTGLASVNEYSDEERHIVKITLQKHIALNTLCNILKNIQNNSRVICSSINYEYNVCRAKVNVKIC